MKRTNIPYNEARQLLLQGEVIKLPDWKGYWKFNFEEKEIEAHTIENTIESAEATYTLHDNWEIATVENCELLKEEKEKRDFIIGGEIVDIHPQLNGTFIAIKNGEQVAITTMGSLISLFGSKVKAIEVIETLIMKDMTEEEKIAFKKADEKVKEIIDDVFEALEKHLK